MKGTNTFHKKESKAKFQFRPTNNETDEEKNVAMLRNADTPQKVEGEQHNVDVTRHQQSMCVTCLLRYTGSLDIRFAAAQSVKPARGGTELQFP